MQLCYAIPFLAILSYGPISVFSTSLANLALKKPVYGSTRHAEDTKATFANNGEITRPDQQYVSRSSDKDPFWRVNLLDTYVVTTVEIVCRMDGFFDTNDRIEIRVGNSFENGGNSNPLCGEPKNLNNIPRHTYRCQLYGRYVYVKKSDTPVVNVLALQEVIVNKELATNVAFNKTTSHSSRYQVKTSSEKAIDGTTSGFNSKNGVFPHWWMIDFAASIPIVKIFLLHIHSINRLDKIIITIGDNSADHGMNNPRFGGVYDFSKTYTSTLYAKPRMSGRYSTIESLKDEQISFAEIEFYSETVPYIEERRNGLVSPAISVYEGQETVLPCHSYAYPPGHIAWVRDGVVLQNRTSDQDTNLVIIANGTKGETKKYECWASNVYGRDLYEITTTNKGRYEMCFKPEEVIDSSRNRFSKQDETKEIQHDKDSFGFSKMYSFFNPLSSSYMKLTTSCPPPSSCGTQAPGWLPDGHPKPEDGVTRRKVCFNYNGDCCYKHLFISVINCPGMFVYRLVNAVFDFPARFCFDDDNSWEAFAPFRSVPQHFIAVGGLNTALANHLIAKDDGIDDTSQCFIVCMMNKCRSFNYDQTEKVCEVNDATRDENPRDLSGKSGFRYYHPMNTPVVLSNVYN